ncbi:MAG: di-heme oxidoredictase family protein [Polyangiaceae bacterium]
MTSRGFWIGTPLVALLLAGCGDGEEGTGRPAASLAKDIYAPLGDVLPSASAEQKDTFERGLAVQLRRFDPSTGLGPDFNVTACGHCHEKPVPGGGAGRYRNFLLQGQTLPDGSFQSTGQNGIQDQYTLATIGRLPDDPDTNVRALRNPIPFFGAGLIAEISGEEILKRADPDDRDGDGISGRPNYDRGFVGRFGRKSQTVSIEGFIRGPLFNHVGLTSDPLPDSLKAKLPVPSASAPAPGGTTSNGNVGTVQQAQAAAPAEPTVDDDGVPDPELPQQDLFDLVSFSMLLAAPQPEAPSEQTERGKVHFDDAGCAKCHAPTLESKRGLIPLYSDLLLHDMGKERADGIRMGEATGSEFRTQPLWGVGAVAPYLHDGAADTLDEAIRLHGGEGEAARDAYLAMDADERGDLIAFLESLGGASQRSEGLLPPDAPVPDVGEYGGPGRKLSVAEMAKFEVGRRVFDREFTVAQGVGLNFNGDSCRACHFDPVIGGAGPSDVDVTRQGIIDGQGMFQEPATGTMAHHQSLKAVRPDLDPSSNFFELRQTPPIFGFGLIDRIADATIIALEDPNDSDGDGIRGIAHVLPDGRVGRLGWKANVPSLAEFARDGLSNELGLSVPPQPPLTFGNGTDKDDAPDPEIAVSDVEALVFFMQQLAPPPRQKETLQVLAGEGIFTQVDCAKCHVPELETTDAVKVPLYSDLLLHEVLPAGAPGIATGKASQLAFRTSPLWGLSKTAPYMHNGRAFTIADAIKAHEGEAKTSRDKFLALSAEDRDALIAFLESL